MSTKINCRSPFYIIASEPTATLSSYSCQDASGIIGTTELQNMTISAGGTISDPLVRNGGVIETRSVTEFSPNTTGSTIPNQSVDFGIRVPQGYTNRGQVITCNAKADQPPTTASGCNASTSKAIFTGDTGGATIGNITNLDNDTAQTISLGTFFSNGSSGAISHYEIFPQNIHNQINVSITGTVPNQTVSFRNNSSSGTITARIVAFNTLDGCTTESNSFTIGLVAGSIGGGGQNTVTLTCDTDDATNDAINASYPDAHIPADGTLNSPPSGQIATFVKYTLRGQSTDITNTGVGTNSSSSSQTINLDAHFTVPNGYTNENQAIVCPIDATQLGTTKPAFHCDNVGITGFNITSSGDILKHDGRVRYNNTDLSFSNVRTNADEQKFAENTGTSSVNRTIKVDFTIPSDFSDGGNPTTCEADFKQAPKPNACAGVDTSNIGTLFFLSRQSFSDKSSFCASNLDFECDTPVNIPTDIHVGAVVCFQGQPYKDGGNQVFGFKRRQPGFVGSGSGSFGTIRINSDGIITEVDSVNCGNSVNNNPIIF